MVQFFGGVNRGIKVIECAPAAFASELAQRWRERNPLPLIPTGNDAATGPLAALNFSSALFSAISCYESNYFSVA